MPTCRFLGKSADEYKTYALGIRKEYSTFPDPVYNRGREAVLKTFIEKERIFATSYFYDLYEARARHNISIELQHLADNQRSDGACKE